MKKVKYKISEDLSTEEKKELRLSKDVSGPNSNHNNS